MMTLQRALARDGNGSVQTPEIWNLPRLLSSCIYVLLYVVCTASILDSSKASFIIRLHVLYVDRINAVLPPDVPSITYRNHLDSLAPRQHIPAVVAAVRDMPGTHLKVVPSSGQGMDSGPC